VARSSGAGASCWGRPRPWTRATSRIRSSTAAIIKPIAKRPTSAIGSRCPVSKHPNHQEHTEQTSGAGTAAALAVHRFLEGAAIALAGSAAVALALAAHAFGEGLATGTLLGGQSRRRAAGWLALMCISPVIGAAAGAFLLPAAAEPVLLAVAAGVLAQAARVSLRAAFRGLRPTRLLLSRPAATTMMAALVTVLAVHGLG
jgi:zinc transporter ZupT